MEPYADGFRYEDDGFFYRTLPDGVWENSVSTGRSRIPLNGELPPTCNINRIVLVASISQDCLLDAPFTIVSVTDC